MARLRERVCVVTGGASGIGAACARLFALEGARVAVLDIDDPAGHELVAQLRMGGAQAHYWHVDVGEEPQVQAALEGVAATFGVIDVLVNNAGIVGSDAPTHAVSESDWDRVQRVNVKGTFFCTKHAIPHMGAGASIVNLSSVEGLVGTPDRAPYHAAEGAITLMTRTDALLYAPRGIRVNSVHPGLVWTPMTFTRLGVAEPDRLEAARHALAALHPLGRIAEPEDIAWGVVYLACSESAFVTGAQLVIDGGYTAR